MKTLDEVIIGIKEQMGLGDPILLDALHYLKEYRDDTENLSEAISNCGKALNKYIMDIHALAQQEENLPLTWSELCTMEGKPVWVERPEWKEWLLISKIDEDKCEIYLRDKWGNGVIVNGRNIGYWQAYRKEKHERLQ